MLARLTTLEEINMENVIESPRRQKISKRIAEIPKIYREVYKKAAIGGSKPAAIKTFCLECVCWQKNEIINCTCVTCPLYSVRPFVRRG
jgi:hypothetical protein